MEMSGRISGNEASGALKQAKKSGSLWLIVAGLAVGVILLLFSGGVGGNKDKSRKTDGEKAPLVINGELDEYRHMTENRIAEACSKVDGAGRVAVTVTLNDCGETVYARETQNTSGKVSEKYVIVGSGSSQAPVQTKNRMPTLTGVGVICDGGDDENVRQSLISLISSAFGVDKDKISVVKMRSTI